MIGMLATSKAGHDKSEVYVIIAEDNEFVYLSDGRLKPLQKPKKKSKKHIQLIKKGIDEGLQKRLIEGETVYDEEIKYVIKKFSRQSQEVSNV